MVNCLWPEYWSRYCSLRTPICRLHKIFHLLVTILSLLLGIGEPPPPLKEKNSKTSCFRRFFSEFFRFRIKSYVIKLIRYHLPTIVKHVLAPKNDVGIPKIAWFICKSFGNWEGPPPPLWEKFPQNPVFFGGGVLYAPGCSNVQVFHPKKRQNPPRHRSDLGLVWKDPKRLLIRINFRGSSCYFCFDYCYAVDFHSALSWLGWHNAEWKSTIKNCENRNA